MNGTDINFQDEVVLALLDIFLGSVETFISFSFTLFQTIVNVVLVQLLNGLFGDTALTGLTGLTGS
ncbi:MAG: hypothetical protein HUU22_04525 [Phycisphaerae bacterium]|nr:hypothetical protein [Phycisphaerae bacterium]NUQ45282.1 hypothetical protein [Phycisphaerae bacterium]